MKTLLILSIALVGCQAATAPAARSAAPGTACRGDLLPDSLISVYVPDGSWCPVDTFKYGAPVVYITWTSQDGDCSRPRAEDMVGQPVRHTGCLKNPPRWMYDTIPTPIPNEF